MEEKAKCRLYDKKWNYVDPGFLLVMGNFHIVGRRNRITSIKHTSIYHSERLRSREPNIPQLWYTYHFQSDRVFFLVSQAIEPLPFLSKEQTGCVKYIIRT